MLGLPSLQKCVCEIFGEIWFEIRFEISSLGWEKSGEIWGEDFSTCQESTTNFGANFGANLGDNFGNFVSNFASFFGNFVQQKGGAKKGQGRNFRQHLPPTVRLPSYNRSHANARGHDEHEDASTGKCKCLRIPSSCCQLYHQWE